MKNKQIYMLAGMFLLLIMCVGMASAATTIDSPIVSTNYSGTINITVTTAVEVVGEFLNITCWYDTAGSTPDTYMTQVTNASAAQTLFTDATFSISGLDDGTTYSIICGTQNGTSSFDENSSATNYVGIDNTVPVISVDRAGAAYIDYMTSISISCSATDATTSVSSTTRTLTKPSGETVTTTTSPYTFSGGDLNEIGKYTFTCSATDNPGNTNSDTVTFTVQTDDDVIIDNGVDDSQKKSSNKLLFLLILGVAAICVIVLILLIGKKK